MTDRELHIHMARVFINQARARRQHGRWHATLLRWAADRRLRAMTKPNTVHFITTLGAIG
jgi:hypothetical protein